MGISPSHVPKAPAMRSATIVPLRKLRVPCSACSLFQDSLPAGLSSDEFGQFEAVIGPRLKLKRGDAAYRAGQPFKAIFAVYVGTLKTRLLDEAGREKVLRFHLPGDVIGLDGIGSDRHACEALALEDTELCVLNFDQVEKMTEKISVLHRNLYRVLSREILRNQNNMLMLGTMRADERLAVFLLDLSERYRGRGYSRSEYNLRMTRDEIGSYLGLKVETVSRLFSRFQEEGLLQVQGRLIKLLDGPRLRQLVERTASTESPR